MNIDEIFRRALAYHRQGKLQDAERLYRSILKLNAKHADANHNMGVMAVHRTQPERALPYLKAALEANPKQAQFWFSYIDALLQAGQKDNAQAVLAQGQSLGLQGAPMDALRDRLVRLQETTKSDAAAVPGPAQQEIDALVALFDQHRFSEVIAGAEGLTTQYPQHFFGWKVLGAALKQTGCDEPALLAMQKAAALSPGDPEAWANLGVAQSVLGQKDEAAASYRKALQIKPDFPEALNNLGALLQDLGRREEALATYQRALQLKPAYAEAQNNLGNLFHEQGQYAEAETCYRKALEINPVFAEAHNRLGVTLREMDRPEAAAASHLEAIRIQPDFADAYNNLCLAYKGLLRFDEAEACLVKALQIKPDFSEAHFNLGLLQKEDGRYAEAEAAFRKVIELKPDFAEVHQSMASLFSDMGRREDAEAWYRHALALDPHSAAPLIGIAGMLSDVGKFAEAEATYRRALEIEPNMPEAWSQLPKCRKMTQDDLPWLDNAERILATPMLPRAELQVHFAIGKFCDDTGRYDKAFAHYQQANALKQKLSKPYVRESEEWLTAQLATAYPAQALRARRAGANPSARPLFILGMPRSGTSLTEQILASHPSVFGAGELSFWSDLSKTSAQAILSGELDAGLVDNIARACLQNLDSFSRDALRVVDKMPGNVKYIGLIHAVFPNARILHTQRNPIDTCLSIFFQNFKKGHEYATDLGDLAHYYREYHRRMLYWRSALPPGVMLDVPYELLVDDQEAWSRKIIDFIGLDWDERCLRFHQTERKVGTASNWQVRQPIYTGSKERWRKYEKYVGPLLPLLELYNPAVQ